MSNGSDARSLATSAGKFILATGVSFIINYLTLLSVLFGGFADWSVLALLAAQLLLNLTIAGIWGRCRQYAVSAGVIGGMMGAALYCAYGALFSGGAAVH